MYTDKINQLSDKLKQGLEYIYTSLSRVDSG